MRYEGYKSWPNEAVQPIGGKGRPPLADLVVRWRNKAASFSDGVQTSDGDVRLRRRRQTADGATGLGPSHVIVFLS